jgi:hypothetical protein
MADWGPIDKPMSHGKTVAGEEGAVIQPHASGGDAPRHAVRYDATDSRHNAEAGLRPWTSIDPMSGPVTDTDWDHSTGRFEDGPGVWRQT